MKIKKINFLILSMFITFIFISFIENNVLHANSDGVGFGVSPILPENQENKRLGYFDLKLEPGQKQDIELKINNTSNKATRFNVNIAYANTNTNGLIEYTEIDKSKADESLKYPLSTIAYTNDSVVEILPHESKTITVTIEMPSERFDGMILGGLHVTKNYDNETKEESNGSVAISNQFAYVIGVKLTQTDTIVNPELHLKYIKPTLHNYRTAVAANIQNSESAVIPSATVEASVYRVGSDVVLNSRTKSNFDIAPNSNVDFMIDWQNKELESGEYRLYMKVTSKERVWEWDELFQIEGKEIKEINSSAIDIEKNNTMLYIIIGFAFLFLIIVLLIILSRRGVFERR